MISQCRAIQCDQCQFGSTAKNKIFSFEMTIWSPHLLCTSAQGKQRLQIMRAGEAQREEAESSRGVVRVEIQMGAWSLPLFFVPRALSAVAFRNGEDESRKVSACVCVTRPLTQRSAGVSLTGVVPNQTSLTVGSLPLWDVFVRRSYHQQRVKCTAPRFVCARCAIWFPRGNSRRARGRIYNNCPPFDEFI